MSVQFNVVVVEATLKQEGDANLTTTVKVSFDGDESSVTCPPTTSSQQNTFAYNMSCQYKRPLTADLLGSLINKDVVVTIFDAQTSQPLCSGSMDLAFLGLGEASTSETIALSPAASSPILVLPGSSALVLLQVQRLQGTTGEVQTESASNSSTEEKWVPYSLVNEADKSTCNILEIRLDPITTLPPKLQPASDVSGGRLACTVGISVDGQDGPVTLGMVPQGLVRSQQISWDKPLRVPLPATVNKVLQFAIEDGQPVHVEIARYLQPGAEQFSDPAFAAYHGYGRVTLSELLVPGSSTASADVMVTTSVAAAVQAGKLSKSVLPPYTAPPSGPKVKPIEEAPPCAADGQLPCPWLDAGTQLTCHLKFWRPLVPPWQPPAAPATNLQELIPCRDFSKPPQTITASDQFQQKIKNIATLLAKEYSATLAGCAPSSSPALRQDLQKQLVFDLNRTGKYLQMRDALKEAVLALVKEHMKRKGSATPGEDIQDQTALHHELFARLLDEMHAALKSLKTLQPPPPTSEDKMEQQLAQLKALADEAEVTGQNTRSQTLHLQRVSLTDKANVQAWYDYAGFCMRSGQQGRAEECLRQAIAHNPEHANSLVALAAVCLHQGLFTDPQQLQTAEVVGHALKDLFPDSPVSWAVLHLVYAVQGAAKAADAKSCLQEVARLGQVSSVWGQSPLEQNPYMQTALLLLDLHLPDEALQALELAKGLPDSAKQLPVDMFLCQARAAQLQGDEGAALEALKQASRSSDSQDIRAAVLAGKLHLQAGRIEHAVTEYLKAYQKKPTKCPLELYLQLGTCYLQQGQFQYAKNVLLQATAVHPCASTWMGLALAHSKLGDLSGADLALTEANVLDPGNPVVWAQLALMALQQKRAKEAEKALEYSYKEGIQDQALLLAIAQEGFDQGLHSLAQSVLVRALAVKDSLQVRCLMAQVLAAQSKQEAARENYLAALDMVSTPEENDQVQRALELLQPFA